jgi:hypothetical protein
MLHIQSRVVGVAITLDPYALHLPSDSAGERPVLEDSPAACLKNFSREKHKRRNEKNQDDQHQSRDDIFEIDQVHPVVHNTVGDAAGHRRAQRKAQLRESA